MILYAIFVVTQFLDAYTTHRALKEGHIEANPVMRYLFEKFTVIGGLIVAKLAGMSAGYVAYIDNLDWALLIMIAIYVWVVINNFKILRRNKR